MRPRPGPRVAGGVPTVLVALLVATSPALQAGKAGEIRVAAFNLLNEGVSAYTRGDFATAVDKLRQSAALALNSFRAHYYLGLALAGDRRYDDAIDALTVALDLDPQHLQGLIALGDAYLKLGDVNEARASYFRALKLRPAFAEALDGLARSYESQADDDQALTYFRQAIASNKGFAPAYTHLGDFYLQRDRLEEAVALLEEAISIRPDYAPGLNRLALAYGKLGLHNEAVATVQRAMQLEPLAARHPATLGLLQLERGSLSAAVTSLETALAIDPALPDARLGLAEVARRRGDYDAALSEIAIALEDRRLDADMEHKLIEYREGLEREHVRVVGLELRVLLGGASAEEREALAAIYAGRGEWERAAKLARLGPSSPEQRERLAYMLTRAGHHREAERIYAELARESPTAALQVNHGVSLSLLGNDAKAIEAYRDALRIDGSSSEAQLYLANALLRSGRLEESSRAYRAYLDLRAEGEAAERVRRILKQIAPDLLPSASDPLPAASPPTRSAERPS